jgi:hypothetical protein
MASQAPAQSDTIIELARKALNNLNTFIGGPVPYPTYYPEGSKPLPSDTIDRTLQKIAGATYALNTGSGVPRNYSGNGNPNGVVTAIAGSLYMDVSNPLNPVLWMKGSGTGNTGWE